MSRIRKPSAQSHLQTAESPPPRYSPPLVTRRPPTPFHFPGPPPDHERDSDDDKGHTNRVKNDDTSNQAGPSLSAEIHTTRRAPSSGNSIPVVCDTQQSTPTTIEYAFPNPFVATATLRARRALNPDHQYVRRPNSSLSEEMSRSSRASTPSSRIRGGCRRGSLVANADAGYATDSDQRIRQRLEDNAIVIPSPSTPTSQNQHQQGKHRNQPLHREYSAGKLRPALRVVQADMSPARPTAGRKDVGGGGVETMQVENEMSIRLSDTSRRGKPLPPHPPLTATDRRTGNGNRRYSQTFSLQTLRRTLPSIGSALRSSPSIELAGPWQAISSNACERPGVVGLPSAAFPAPLHPSRLPSVPSSATRSVAALQGSHLTQSSSTAQQRIQAASLKDPADNLNIYLRLAHLPKWTRWIDPDRDVQSRWHNTSNWGTGRANHSSKDPQSSRVASGATDRRSVMVSSHGIGEMSGRARTIDRLVQSVVTNQMCSDGIAIEAQQQRRQVPSLPSSSSSLTANIPNLDPGKRESAAAPADQLADQVAKRRRFLNSWEVRRGFLDGIENFYEKNVPYNSIDPANRWGEQLFALEANGFHTVRFHDEAAVRTEDAGLLGWFTGAVLKTAVSALHMLRYNAQDFGFHVLPASLAARVTTGEQGHHHFERGGRSVDVPAELPDGCGSLVLVNKRVAKDRAMVVMVRPPWLIGSAELMDFAKAALDWRQGSSTYLETQEGQANLLQAQVFDDCYSNYCFFFCVTNLKHWNPDFTRCAVGPVISRKAKGPSVMQVLTVWLIRSFDERPQAETTAARSLPPEHGQPEEIPASSRLQLIPTSVRPRGSFLPAHDSGSALGTGHPYQQGLGYGSQYTDVQARHHTSLPPWNFSNVFAAPCTPSQGHPYANSSSSTRPSWYDMTFQQRHPISGGDSSQYPPPNYSGAPPYLPYYHSTSSPPISPLGSTPTHATYFEDDQRRTRDSFGRR